MKKNIGPVFALYPTPSTVVGTIVNDRVNWANVAHIGIIGLDCLMLSLRKNHYTNINIRACKSVSVNIVSEDMLVEADYVGLVSGKNTDKSGVFPYHVGDLNTPIINQSPVSMECKLIDIYNTDQYDNFIFRVINTYVNEEILDENGDIDYDKVKPVLFEMPTVKYLETGKVLGKCWSVGKQYHK